MSIVKSDRYKKVILKMECDPRECPYMTVEAVVEIEGTPPDFLKTKIVVDAVHKIARDFKLTGIVHVTVFTIVGSETRLTFSLGTNIPPVVMSLWRFKTIHLVPALPIGEYDNVGIYVCKSEDDAQKERYT